MNVLIIRRAYIYGFHQWIDQEFQFNKGFNYIYGANEAGKSTLQKFILFMFYGLPPRERNEAYPKNSSRMGGRLEIIDGKYGLISLERLDGINNGKVMCTLENGDKKDENWLNKRLHHISKKVYKAVFAFSSLDLHQDQETTEDGLGMTILDIGLTGAKDIRELELNLEKQLDDLFKPAGRVPTMNKKITEMNALEKQFTQLKNEEATYNELINKRIALEAEINKLHKLIKGTSYSLDLLEKQTFILPLLSRYSVLHEKIKPLKDIRVISTERKNRFTFIHNQLLKLAGKKNVLKHEYNDLKEKLENQQNLLAEEKFHEIKRLAEMVPAMRERLAVYHNRKIRYEKEKEKLRKDLKDLQLNITVDQLAVYQFPFYLREEWTSLRNEITTAERKIEQLSEQNKRLRTELVVLDEKIKETKNQLLPEHIVEQVINELNQLNDKEIETSVVNDQSAKESLPKRRIFIKKQKAKKLRQIILILAVTLAAIGFLFYKPLIIGAILLIGFNVWHKKEVSEQLDELILLQNELEKEPVQINQELIKRKEYLNDQLTAHKYEEQRLEQMNEENESKSNTCIELDEQLFQLEESLKSSLKEQKRYEEEYPFLKNIDLTYWTELLTNLINLQKRFEALLEEEQSLHDENDAINHFMEQVEQSIDNETINQEHSSPLIKLNLLEKIYEEEENHRKAHEERLKLIERKEKELMQLDKEMTPYLEEQRQIKTDARVETEEEFFENVDKSLERLTLLEKIEETEISLDQVFTRNEWVSYYKARPTEFILKQKTEKFKHRLEVYRQKLLEKEQQITKIIIEINRLEKEGSFAEVAQRYENESASLKHYTKQWASYQLLRAILNETKQTYKMKYLKWVVEKAKGYFQYSTDNTYVEIMLKQDGREQFMVKRFDGLSFSLHELSRGTLDLFYVSLKLATSEVMASEYNLPFVIDDAFIHFDQQRRAKMLEILKEISENRQVFYFSCIENESDNLQMNEIINL